MCGYNFTPLSGTALLGVEVAFIMTCRRSMSKIDIDDRALALHAQGPQSYVSLQGEE